MSENLLDFSKLPPPDPAKVAQHELDDGGHGLDAEAFAWKDCPRCHGSGYEKIHEEGAAFPREQVCACSLERRRRYAIDIYIRKLFGPGGAKMTFANYDPGNSDNNRGAYDACLNYVDAFPRLRKEGYGLAFAGPPGCGKTHLAHAILIKLIKCYPSANGGLLRVSALSVPELMHLARKRIRDGHDEDVIEKATIADVTLLDDIGAERHKYDGGGMSWVDEQLYLILNYRLTHNLPTLYTTNLSPSEFQQVMDERIARRLKTKTLHILHLEKVEGYDRPDPQIAELLLRQRNKK